MLKKDTLGTATAKSLVEAFRCSECLHFKNHPHSQKQQVCIKEGVKPAAIAPKCFTPDVTILTGNSDQFVQLAALFHAYDAKQKRVLLALLRSKKKGYSIGTRLYFKIGKDFISNYLAGYVAGYTSTGELMLIGSPSPKERGQSFTSYMAPNSDGLLTVTQWKAKRAELQASNLVHDPANKVIKRASVVDAYEPPTLDTVPSWFYDKKVKPPARRKVTDEISFTVA